MFSIGEEVRETSDSGFLGTVATLHTQLLEDGSMLQVGGGVRWEGGLGGVDGLDGSSLQVGGWVGVHRKMGVGRVLFWG